MQQDITLSQYYLLRTWELTWSKLVFTAVRKPSNWKYMVQKQVIGGQVALTETQFILLRIGVPLNDFEAVFF